MNFYNRTNDRNELSGKGALPVEWRDHLISSCLIESEFSEEKKNSHVFGFRRRGRGSLEVGPERWGDGAGRDDGDCWWRIRFSDGEILLFRRLLSPSGRFSHVRCRRRKQPRPKVAVSVGCGSNRQVSQGEQIEGMEHNKIIRFSISVFFVLPFSPSLSAPWSTISVRIPR